MSEEQTKYICKKTPKYFEKDTDQQYSCWHLIRKRLDAWETLEAVARNKNPHEQKCHTSINTDSPSMKRMHTIIIRYNQVYRNNEFPHFKKNVRKLFRTTQSNVLQRTPLSTTLHSLGSWGMCLTRLKQQCV